MSAKRCVIRVGYYDALLELHADACSVEAGFLVDGYPVCPKHMKRMFDPAINYDRWIIYSTHPDQHVIMFKVPEDKMPKIEELKHA